MRNQFRGYGEVDGTPTDGVRETSGRGSCRQSSQWRSVAAKRTRLLNRLSQLIDIQLHPAAHSGPRGPSMAGQFRRCARSICTVPQGTLRWCWTRQSPVSLEFGIS